MAILVHRDTQMIIQGITGRQGSFHTARSLEYGAKVVGGTAPGRGGAKVEGVPVFDTVAEAKAHARVDASLILVPPAGVLDAAVEAIENHIPLVVIVTEHVPVLDAMQIVALARQHGVRVIGPNTIGVITPGESKVGIMPGFIYSPGRIGIVSRSGTLTHEVASNLTYRGIGQSTCVGIGGDPIIGAPFTDILQLFAEDPGTDAVVMIGEVGGAAEEQAAEYLKSVKYPKPVCAFIAGATAPPGKRMGHAGAIVERGVGTAASKVKALTEAGVTVARTLDDIVRWAGGRTAAAG